MFKEKELDVYPEFKAQGMSSANEEVAMPEALRSRANVQQPTKQTASGLWVEKACMIDEEISRC